MKRLSVLIIPENYPTEINPSAGIFITDQIRALAPHVDITVFNSNPWYRGVYQQLESAQFYDFNLFDKKPPSILKPIAYKWWERQSLKMAFRLPRADFVHLHGAALRGTWTAELAKSWNVPLAITEHTGPWSRISERPALLRRAKKVLDHADCVLPVSHHLHSEMYASGIRPKRTEVFGNPVDTDTFSLRHLPLRAHKTALFVGRLDPFKGALRALQAFHAASIDIPDYKLCIAGTGVEESEIRKYIFQHNLDNKVQFIDRQLTRSEMKDLFYDASFLIFPSEFESFGLVAAEAMSTGLPVVITNRTGPLDYSNGKNSILVDPENIESIKKGILKMIRSIDTFDPVEIRKGLIEEYGFKRYGKKILETIQNLL